MGMVQMLMHSAFPPFRRWFDCWDWLVGTVAATKSSPLGFALPTSTGMNIRVIECFTMLYPRIGWRTHLQLSTITIYNSLYFGLKIMVSRRHHLNKSMLARSLSQDAKKRLEQKEDFQRQVPFFVDDVWRWCLLLLFLTNIISKIIFYDKCFFIFTSLVVPLSLALYLSLSITTSWPPSSSAAAPPSLWFLLWIIILKRTHLIFTPRGSRTCIDPLLDHCFWRVFDLATGRTMIIGINLTLLYKTVCLSLWFWSGVLSCVILMLRTAGWELCKREEDHVRAAQGVNCRNSTLLLCGCLKVRARVDMLEQYYVFWFQLRFCVRFFQSHQIECL